jgi:hypothetical protein
MSHVIVAVLAFCAGGAAGAYLSERARKAAAEALGYANQRIDAWRHADARADLDIVGPVTGDTKAAGR